MTKESQIRAVIFDYGGVLSLPQQPSELRSMAELLGVESERLEGAYRRWRIPYDCGALTDEEYWSKTASLCGVTLAAGKMPELIRLDNQSWSYPNQVTIKWVPYLQGLDVRVALLSNMPSGLKEHLGRYCLWLPRFEHCMFSCDVRCAKPDPEIYLHCAALLGIAPDQTLFFDDKLTNVEGAQRVGMKGICFTGAGAVADQVKKHFDLELPVVN